MYTFLPAVYAAWLGMDLAWTRAGPEGGAKAGAEAGAGVGAEGKAGAGAGAGADAFSELAPLSPLQPFLQL